MLKNKFMRVPLAILALFALLFTLASCGGDTDGNDTVGEARIVIMDVEPTEYTVPLDALGTSGGVLGALEYLKENEGLTYTAIDGGYGAYLTALGSLEQNAAEGKYLYVYTSVASDMDVSAYAQTVEYDGISLTSSGVGISEMTLTDGVIIYFTYIIY